MVRIKLAIIQSARAKDGSHRIRIAIGHKSETHYIVTPYSVPSLANFKNGTIIGTPTAHHDNLKLRQLLTDYEHRLELIPNPSDYTPRQLRDRLKSMHPLSCQMTIMAMYDTIIAEQIADKRFTRTTKYSRDKFSTYINGDLSLSDITPATIDGFIRHLHHLRHKPNTINTILEQLRKVINRAIRDGHFRYDIHPCAYLHTEKSEYRQIDISVADLRRIRDSQPSSPSLRQTRDIFMLSYYLGGINFVDLIAIDFRKANGILSYIRRKTSASATRVEFSIHPSAQAIIDRLIGTDGHIKAYRHKLTSACNFNLRIKELGHEIGLPNADKLCYYTARKSFVQHGFDLGISLDTLEYCIGHSVQRSRTIYNYMRVMRKHADAAISSIIANIDADKQ